MDGKRGHVTCGNQLAIERQELVKKIAGLEEDQRTPALLRPVGTLQDFALLDMGKMTQSRQNENVCFFNLRVMHLIV